jgi:hypothetical protein
VSKAKNVKLSTAFKGMGAKVEPLTAKEEQAVERKVKAMKDATEIVPFDAQSDIIIGILPDSKAPTRTTMKSGDELIRVSVILADGRWASFLTDDEDVMTACEASPGAMVAVVGKLMEKGEFWNINRYRGLIIFADLEMAGEDDV